MCLAIRERGVTGALERKLDAADQQLERYKRRTETLQKQVSSTQHLAKNLRNSQKCRVRTLQSFLKTSSILGESERVGKNEPRKRQHNVKRIHPSMSHRDFTQLIAIAEGIELEPIHNSSYFLHYPFDTKQNSRFYGGINAIKSRRIV